MAAKRGAKTSKRAGKLKSLRAKGLSARQAKGVKGGDKTKGGEGKATFHDLNFTHNIDKSSPVL